MDTISLLEQYKAFLEKFWKQALLASGLVIIGVILAYYFLLPGSILLLLGVAFFVYLFYKKSKLKKQIISRISQIIGVWNQGYRIAIYDGGDRVLLLDDELDVELGPYIVRITKTPEPGAQMLVEFGYVFLNGSFLVKYNSNYSQLYLNLYFKNKNYALIISPEGIQEQGEKEFFEEHFADALETILSEFKNSKLTVGKLIDVSREISRKAKSLSKKAS